MAWIENDNQYDMSQDKKGNPRPGDVPEDRYAGISLRFGLKEDQYVPNRRKIISVIGHLIVDEFIQGGKGSPLTFSVMGKDLAEMYRLLKEAGYEEMALR